MEDCKFSITFGVTNVEFNLELISASGRYIDEYSSRDYVSWSKLNEIKAIKLFGLGMPKHLWANPQ